MLLQFSTDRDDLDSKSDVEKVQRLVLSCLHNVIARHRPSSQWSLVIGRLFTTLVVARELSQDCTQDQEVVEVYRQVIARNVAVWSDSVMSSVE